MATLHDNPAMECGDHKGECGCVLKMYSAMVSGDQESECVCVCVSDEDVSSYGIW